MSAEQLRSAAGVAQIGSSEIDALRNGQNPANIGRRIDPHPELTGGNPLSDHNQIFAAAAYLSLLQKQGGSMDMAIRLYNGGANGGGALNDPQYMEKHANALAIFDSFGL